jgi:glutathione S-transferase
MLKDDKRWVADSTKIALYLDATYPEHALLRRDESLRKQALDIDEFVGELGIHVRRWTLAQALSIGDHPLEIMMGEQGYLRQFEKISKPILKSLVSTNYKLNPEKVEKSKIRMTELIADLNQRLIDNQGRYLVGDRLGLADIAVCSMLAPLLVIKGTPWELENDDLEQFSGELKQYHDDLLDLPLGQYVQRIYATERNARVDWRGM